MRENGILGKSVLSEADYQSYVRGAKSMVERVRNALGSDRDVQERLLELVESFNKVGTHITEADYPSNIRDEKMRYAALGNRRCYH